MKNLKKIVTLVLCAMMLASLFSVQAFAEESTSSATSAEQSSAETTTNKTPSNPTDAFKLYFSRFTELTQKYVAAYNKQMTANAKAEAGKFQSAMKAKWNEVSDSETGVVATAWARAQSELTTMETAAVKAATDFYASAYAAFQANIEAITPAADQPAADQPAADQPAADQPAADQPAADQPAADQPAADE